MYLFRGSDRAGGAGVRAGAAVEAGAGVNLILGVALGDRADRTYVRASAAADASRADLISHSVVPPFGLMDSVYHAAVKMQEERYKKS